MAMNLLGVPELPQHITVSAYTVERLEVPVLSLQFAETVDATEPAAAVSATDGVRIVVPAWKGRTDLIGKDILVGQTVVATIESVEAEVLDEAQNVTTPETIVLIAAPSQSLSGKSVTLKVINASGAVAHRRADSGRSWQINVVMQGDGTTLLNQLLGGASVELVMKVLAAMGDTTYTQEQVLQGVMALALTGENLDSILASKAESVELARQAGALSFARVMGLAPR